MEGKKVELINPYNKKQMEMMKDFCIANHIPDVYEKLKIIPSATEEKTYLQNRLNDSIIDDFIIITSNNKITDCCIVHTEKDIRKCFLTLPNIQDRKHTKDNKLIRLASEYAISLGIEEIFMNASNNDLFLQENLVNLGFTSLGADDTTTPFILVVDEKRKHEVIL